MAEKLTSKQRKFIEVYSGNATEAARLAGYSGSDDTLRQVGAENLAKPHIASAIREREQKEIRPLVATRVQRQEFWTQVMNDRGEEMPTRLRASELLAKSESDFTLKVETKLEGEVEVKVSRVDLSERIKQLKGEK